MEVNRVSCIDIMKIFGYAVKIRSIPCIDIFDRFQWMLKVICKERKTVSIYQWHFFVLYISKRLEMSYYELSYEVYLNKQFDSISLGLLRLVPIPILQKFVSKHINEMFNGNLSLKIVAFDEKQVILELNFIDENLYSKMLCDYHKGAIRAVLESRGHKNVDVTEKYCYFSDKTKLCTFCYTWSSYNKPKYYSVLKNMVDVFLKGDIQDYVWDSYKIKMPTAADDLDELY